ncbi:MAG: polyphosphate kinase 1 [Limnohabitans sp.]|nr:polyphosphate kinase 1 [Limnohabitans sp.]
MRKPISLTSDDSNSGIELLDRDGSILAFNERVLDWAKRPEVPLLERLRYLCIVSSNLDEFFEVRADLHMSAFRNKDEKGTYNTKTFEIVYNTARDLVNEQYSLYNAVLLPSLQKEGIKILSHGERNLVQKKWVRDYFRREVNPLLVPVGLDPARPFPQVANKSLNFIVQLSGKDAFGRSNDIAIVKVPRVLPRVIPLPAKVAGHGKAFVLLSSVIRAHLNDLFPGRDVGQFSQFRVTRNSDLSVDEEEVENLRTALREGLQHRQYGQALRLEVSDSCSEHLSDFLLKQFRLPKSALFRAAGPVNLVRLSQLIDLVDDPALLFPAYQSSFPKQLKQGESIFARMQKGDVLMHQPFESFDGVLAFLKEAVEDPQVLAIKQTIYRTGSDPAMMNLLREAVRRGKEVTAVVELKARFDEEANINWAEQLESVGAQVVYGFVGLKTHAKMLLVTRREGRVLKRYGHLSTGNYNPRTAKLYTDLSYLTSDARMTADMETLFVHLASPSRLGRMNKLWAAPFLLQKNMVEKIEAVGAAAAKGLPARIVAKMNSLTDPVLIHALISAGQKGAQIDLIIRGACMLPAGIPGKTDNIRVRSIIGRFLEHSRVFFFEADTVQDIYLSSADWMTRNMTRRVELAWPVLELSLRQRLIDECLLAYLHDTRNAWTLDADGKYRRVEKQGRKPQSAQALLMEKYSLAQTKSR